MDDIGKIKTENAKDKKILDEIKNQYNKILETRATDDYFNPAGNQQKAIDSRIEKLSTEQLKTEIKKLIQIYETTRSEIKSLKIKEISEDVWAEIKKPKPKPEAPKKEEVLMIKEEIKEEAPKSEN